MPHEFGPTHYVETHAREVNFLDVYSRLRLAHIRTDIFFPQKPGEP